MPKAMHMVQNGSESDAHDGFDGKDPHRDNSDNSNENTTWDTRTQESINLAVDQYQELETVPIKMIYQIKNVESFLFIAKFAWRSGHSLGGNRSDCPTCDYNTFKSAL
jgi:hypothetical protein